LHFDGGFFVELGAGDGLNLTNTLYFEKYRNWRGILVDPALTNVLSCLENRKRLPLAYQINLKIGMWI